MTQKDIGAAMTDFLTHKPGVTGDPLLALIIRYEKRYGKPARENWHFTEDFVKKLAELTIYRENEISLFRAFEKDINDFLLDTVS